MEAESYQAAEPPADPPITTMSRAGRIAEPPEVMPRWYRSASFAGMIQVTDGSRPRLRGCGTSVRRADDPGALLSAGSQPALPPSPPGFPVAHAGGGAPGDPGSPALRLPGALGRPQGRRHRAHERDRPGGDAGPLR